MSIAPMQAFCLVPDVSTRIEPPTPPRPSRWQRFAHACLLILALSSVANVAADSQDDRRMRTGARLFRALLAAEVGLELRLDRGVLPILLLGGDNLDEAGAVIAPEGEASVIRDLPIRLSKVSHFAVPARRPAAIFLSTPLSQNEFESVLAYARREQVLVFSPFAGDVERGAHAGLSIEAKVQPFINAGALKASGIELKPFFLKVAKVHP